MSLTSILIIFLVLCMSVGPVFMLQPSKRQRQLAQTRTQAAKKGLKVRETEFNKQLLALYSLEWLTDDSRKFKGPAFTLVKKEYSHGLHLCDFWEAQPQLTNNVLKNAMLQVIPAWPKSVCGAAASAEGFGMYWKETGGDAGLNLIEEQLKEARERVWPLLSEVRAISQA